MFGWLANLLRAVSPYLGPLGDLLLKLMKGAPNPAVTEAEKAGAAEQSLADERAHEAEIEKAADAGRAADAAVADDDGLRQYAEHDPNNRARPASAP